MCPRRELSLGTGIVVSQNPGRELGTSSRLPSNCTGHCPTAQTLSGAPVRSAMLALWLLLGVATLQALPPPITLNCTSKEIHRLNSPLRYTCLWQSPLQLTYGPSPGTDTSGAAPTLTWFINETVEATATQWAGTQDLVGVPMDTPITLSYTCPDCLYQNVTIHTANLDLLFFTLSSHLIAHQDVQLAWCANLQTSEWTYSVSCPGGTPASSSRTGEQLAQIESASFPEGKEAECTPGYQYLITVQYTQVGDYFCTLDVTRGPRSSQQIFFQVKPVMLLLLRAETAPLRLTQRLIVSWRLATEGSVISYQLGARPVGRTAWTLTYHPNAFGTALAACTWPRASDCITQLLLVVNHTIFRAATATVTFFNQEFSFVHHGTLVKLTPNAAAQGTGVYYISSSKQLYYSRIDGPAGSHSHFLLLSDKEISHVFLLNYTSPGHYSLTVQLYLNLRATIYSSLQDLNVSVSLFNSSPVYLGQQVDVVWFLPPQHPALHPAWLFQLTLGTTVTLHGYNTMVVDAQRYIPDVQLPFDPRQFSGFLVKVRCLTPGEMLVGLRANIGTYSFTPVDTVLFCDLDSCKLPSPTIDQPPPPDTTIRTARSAPLVVYGEAGLQCDSIDSVTLSWKVYTVADVTAQPDLANIVPLPPSVQTNTATLHLPAFSLDYGLYLFIFNVSMTTTDPKLPYLNNSRQALVEVTKSQLVAVILGGSYRTVSLEDTVILDATPSADPDSLDPHLGLTFSWYCTMKYSDYNTMTLSHNQYCHPGNPTLQWNSSTPEILDIPPHTLSVRRNIYFRVRVEKDTRTSYFDQTIWVLPGFVPSALIICIENCETTLIPTDRFISNGSCPGCPDSSQLRYQWGLFAAGSLSEINFDWSSESLTGNSLSYVSFNPLAFIKFAEGQYILELKITTSNDSFSLTKYPFLINLPPKIGRCAIHPKLGWALETQFTLVCLKFEDRDMPLQYKAIALTYYPTGHIDSLKTVLLGTIVYFGYRPNSSRFLLPVGSTSGRHLLVVAVLVSDRHGAFTRVNLKVRVYDHPVDVALRSKVNKLFSFVEGKAALLTTLLHGTDYVKANQLLYEVASVLNANSFSGTDTARVDKLRETLFNVSASIPVTSPKLINQISASIFEAAQKSEEVNEHAQRLGATKLLELSTVLLNYTTGAVVSSESAELLSCSILTAASNVVAAFTSDFPAQGTEDGFPLSPDQQQVPIGIFPALRTLTEAISHSKVPGQRDTWMQTRQWEIMVRKTEKRKLEDSYLSDLNCVNCVYPMLAEDGGMTGATQPVTSVMYTFDENPLPWLGKAAERATDVTGFHMSTLDGSGAVRNLVPKQIETFLPRRDLVSSQRVKMARDSKLKAMIRGRFKMKINSTSAQEVFLQLIVDLSYVFTVSIYSGNYSADHAPAQQHTVPACVVGPPFFKSLHEQDPYIFRIPTSLFQKNATDPKGSRFITVVIQTETPTAFPIIKSGVIVSVFVASCLTFQGISDNWDSSSCTTGPLTGGKKVHCICKTVPSNITKRQVSLTFPWFLTANILVLPDIIDLFEIGDLIETLPRNLVTLLTVLTILLIYCLLVCWAWRKRESDKKQIIILPDNHRCDTAYYLVTLYTGGRYDAGTSADVFLTLVSTSLESDAHLLHHPDYRTLRRNSIDTFLLTTKDDLGDLTFIKVWHNNMGPSPSWYLSRVKVQNVLTRQLWYFFCRKWLATRKEDGLLHRTFPATDSGTLLRRRDVFFIETSSKIEKEHLWFSVFAFDIDQSFTRIQRLSCCLTMLLCSLLCSITLFQKEPHKDFGRRIFTSLVIGVESALVMVPVEILISSLFIYAQRKDVSLTIEGEEPNAGQDIDGKPHNLRERLKHWYLMDEPTSEVEESPKKVADTADDEHYNRLSFIAGVENTQEPSAKGNKNCTMPQSVADQISPEESVEEVDGSKTPAIMKAKPMGKPRQVGRHKKMKGTSAQSSKNIVPKKQPSVALSRCLLCLAWCIVCLLSAVSAVFIILYGLSYGVETSWLWLMASSLSFLQSVFLLQPLTIMAFATLFALRSRRVRDVDWPTRIQVLEVRIEQLPESCSRPEAKARKQYRPLEGDELILAKRKGTTRHRAFVLCRNVFIHLVFLALIFHSVCYTDYHNAYHYNKIVQDKFSQNLEQFNTVQEFYTWMSITFLPLIHQDSSPAFLFDTSSIILGLPRMRQIRSKEASVDCFAKGSILFILGKQRCRPLFDIQQQDTKDYNGSWKLPVESVPVKDPLDYTGWVYETIYSPWFYNSRGTYQVYPLGGYSLYFIPSNLQTSIVRLLDLQNSNWVDRSTWAIIIETTIYNANVDLLCTISLILETGPLGVVNKRLVVKSFSLRLFERGETKWKVISALFILLFFIFTIDEYMKIKRKGYMYFQTPSNITCLVMTVLLLMAIILYVAKFILSHFMLRFYKENPTTFVAFHVISALDQLLRFNVGFLIMAAILKLLKYTRFLYDVRLAQKAITVAFPVIFSLALIMVVYSLIFMSFGHLLFGQFDSSFNTLLHAAQTIVSYYTGDFRDTEFAYNKVIGGIYLASFVFIMNCILLNLFESVVILSYGDVRQYVHERQSDEADVANFVVQECRRVWYALWKKTPPKDGNRLLTNLFYGRGSERTYGLKRKKINGMKMDYLVI
uniref:polycystin family receptor for egg jelly-like n=1 Tax=Pristiophorus japonicus TaxID=55135 RepID=UPI00398E8EB6